jgi:3-mercaptopropionate dioxygenase
VDAGARARKLGRGGIVEGVLEERALMSAHGDITADEGIVLRRGGMVPLNPVSVSSFVPNPDHIHRTGVPWNRAPCIGLISTAAT